MDVSPVYWEREFYSFLFQFILKKGGTRLQVTSSDVVDEMQKLPPKHCVNLQRKQYGNITQCLKTSKHPFFLFDSNIVKLKDKQDIVKLYQQKHISEDNFKLYQSTYDEVQKKLIEVMIINRSNKCRVCGREYKILINRPGMCGDEEDLKLSHIPIYEIP